MARESQAYLKTTHTLERLNEERRSKGIKSEVGLKNHLSEGVLGIQVLRKEYKLQ